MAQKSNPKLIGGFVVGAFTLVVIGIGLIGGGTFFAERVPYVMYFEGSVKGLQVGAPVDFRGVRIGSVTDIRAVVDGSDLSIRIPVFAEIEPDRVAEINVPEDLTAERGSGRFMRLLIQQGLRAQLELESLVTGQLFVQLDFHPDTPIKLVGADDKVPELPTIPSAMEVLESSVSGTLAELRELPLKDLVLRLIDAAESIDGTVVEIKKLVQDIDDQVEPLATSVIATSDQARLTLQKAESRLSMEEGEVLYDIRQTLGDARRLIRGVDSKIDPIAESAIQALDAAVATLEQAQSALVEVDKGLGEQSPLRFELTTTIREVRATVTSIRILAEYLQRNPNAILTGKP